MQIILSMLKCIIILSYIWINSHALVSYLLSLNIVNCKLSLNAVYGKIDMLDDTQRSFTRNINGMEGLDYAQRLKKLKMYSIQRRHERYKILYVYKIKEKLVPNVTQSHGLYFEYGRRGCECKLPYQERNEKSKRKFFCPDCA